ncbi:MAG: DNA-3-methyladenine glycosylase I [Phycisphaerales bacterium]
MGEVIRCPWAKPGLYAKYHDEEWGVPLHDDQALFEMLILEGAQAGLSWETILNKREAYRAAFDGFDAAKIAKYDARRRAKLMNNAGIVRNRLKINAAIENAKAYLKVREEFAGKGGGKGGRAGGFDVYIWSFVGGEPIVNRRKSLKEVPAQTEVSDAMSKDLKKRGFKFVGSTICYAYMQAVGMVNDHLVSCAWHSAEHKRKR